jgi:hypothetical protein
MRDHSFVPAFIAGLSRLFDDATAQPDLMFV